MTNVKTLAEEEALANNDAGYMNRPRLDYQTFYGCYIGDNIVSWSTNTLSNQCIITQPSS